MFRCHHHCEEDFESELARIGHMLNAIFDQGVQIMSAQDDINAAVTSIQAIAGDLGTAVGNIQAEIAALQASGTPVDTTGLDAAVDALKTAAQAVDALETPAPADPGAGDGAADAGEPVLADAGAADDSAAVSADDGTVSA